MTIKDCKAEKQQIEKQISSILSDFCTKYDVTLNSIELEKVPDYANGSTLWSGKNIELRIIL